MQSLKGQCPNAFGLFFGGASLNNLYFKKIVSFPMCELQYMFAADMISVSCLNTMLQGEFDNNGLFNSYNRKG